MKHLLTILVLLIFSSCIPLRIAPTIDDDKVMLAKKIKRNLPRSYAFIFEDPKETNEFYNYINTKHELNHQDVEWNIPFIIDDEEFFFSFYEVEIPTKTINLIPIFIDAGLDSNGYDPVFEDSQFSRIGHWYIALTVSDANMDDCLKPNYKFRKEILMYLRDLRMEYLDTNNYIEALLKK